MGMVPEYGFCFSGSFCSVVGVASHCKLNDPLESHWKRDRDWPPRPVQLPVQWVPGLFPRGKVAGAWCWPPTHYSQLWI